MEWVIRNKEWIFSGIGIIIIIALYPLIHYFIWFIKRRKKEKKEIMSIQKLIQESTITENISERVKAIIVDKMGIEEKEVTFEASFTNDLGADSLDTVELIMEFEKEFGISIPDHLAERIITVGDAANYISAVVPKNPKEMDIFPKQIKEEMLLYITLDGKIKVIPVFKDEMGNLIQVENTTDEKGELTKEKELEIYYINKKKQKYEEKAEELEYLLSREHIKENELQKFFERNPEFILDGEYCKAIPQVILKDENDKKSIPDFILKPNENISVPAKIIELKLPNVKTIHNYTRAEAFTQKINIAVGQLRKYYRYFNSDENRKKFLEKYHFQVFRPRLALIVGKDIVDIDKETLDD